VPYNHVMALNLNIFKIVLFFNKKNGACKNTKVDGTLVNLRLTGVESCMSKYQ
jgi:hypothetical protein